MSERDFLPAEAPQDHEVIFNLSHGLVAPGQGNQEIGMGMALAQRSPAAAAIWAEANRVLYPFLGYTFTDLVWHGTQDVLTQTENAQPAIIADSLARQAALQESGQDDNPGWNAGNSLGFITALVTAGSLSIESAVQLSKARGEAFKKAIDPNDKTTMMVCSKVDLKIITSLMKQFSLDITLVNTPLQIVLGGRVANITRAAEYFTSQFDKTSGRIIPLEVDAAFHSRHMAPAVPYYAQALKSIEITKPTHGRLIGASKKAKELITPDEIRAELIAQLTHPERWDRVISYLQRQGVVIMTELNESPRLLHMVREIAGGGPRPQKITTLPLSPKDRGVPIAQRWRTAA